MSMAWLRLLIVHSFTCNMFWLLPKLWLYLSLHHVLGSTCPCVCSFLLPAPCPWQNMAYWLPLPIPWCPWQHLLLFLPLPATRPWQPCDCYALYLEYVLVSTRPWDCYSLYLQHVPDSTWPCDFLFPLPKKCPWQYLALWLLLSLSATCPWQHLPLWIFNPLPLLGLVTVTSFICNMSLTAFDLVTLPSFTCNMSFTALGLVTVSFTILPEKNNLHPSK